MEEALVKKLKQIHIYVERQLYQQVSKLSAQRVREYICSDCSLTLGVSCHMLCGKAKIFYRISIPIETFKLVKLN